MALETVEKRSIPSTLHYLTSDLSDNRPISLVSKCSKNITAKTKLENPNAHL